MSTTFAISFQDGAISALIWSENQPTTSEPQFIKTPITIDYQVRLLSIVWSLRSAEKPS